MDIHNKLVSQTYTAARSAAAPMPGTTDPAANPVASSVSAFAEVLAERPREPAAVAGLERLLARADARGARAAQP